MRAELFYLESQAEWIAGVAEQIPRAMSPAIAVSLRAFNPRSAETGQIGFRYVKLLHAAIPPEKKIGIELNGMEMMGYRFYIRVYYPLGWFGAFKYFQDEQLETFFPAVAIQDRMALIPAGLGDKLADPNDAVSPFSTLQAGGIMEVDFRQQAAVTRACEILKQKLRNDFIGNLQAYGRYHNLREVSPHQLSLDLNVDIAFVQEILKGDSRAFERACYEQLRCELDPVKLAHGRWTRVTLTIHNASDQDLAELSAELAGPVKIRPERLSIGIPPQSSRQIELAIMPDDKGDFPIEVTFALPEDRPFATWLPFHHVWLASD